MIGFAYFKNSDASQEFMAYIPKKGWIKTKDHALFNKYSKILFVTNISNIKELPVQKNVKKEDFFGYNFEQIIYYFNASKIELKEKLKLVSSLFVEVLDFYKSNFNKEIELNELLNIDSFSSIYENIFKDDFKFDNIFPEDLILKQSQTIYSSEQELVNFYIQRNEFEILESMLNIEIPLENLDYVDIKELGEIKNIEHAINTFSSEYFLMIKGSLRNFSVYNKKLLLDRLYGENSLFFKDELLFLNNYSEIKIEGFYLSQKFTELESLLNYKPKVKKTKLANRIVIFNYIKKLKYEISKNETLGFYLEQKDFSENFKNVCVLKKNGFNIIAYTNSEIIVSTKKEGVENLLKEVEKLHLLYSTDLISYFQ